MENELRKLLDDMINPVLKNHNGGCELVKIENSIAFIQLTGSCKNCPGKRFTFDKQAIPYILNNIPDLEGVELI